jgi:tetratricopeptide (TPR) repeat protein
VKTHATFRLHALAAALLLAVAGVLPAQVLVMKDGRKIPAPGAARRGDKIYVTVRVGPSAGQIAYDAKLIQTVNLPESPELIVAERLMADDKAGEALTYLDKVIRPAEAFRGLGDDRWGHAQLLKSSALSMIGKQAEARAVLSSVATHDAGTTAAKVAELRLDSFEEWNAGKADQWLRRAESASGPDNPAPVRAAAYVLKARVLHDREKYEDALVAALNVPIFFAAERFDSSRAQLIAADCYLQLGDKQRAVRAYYDVTRNFPNTAASTLSQKEISKGGEPFAMIVKNLQLQEKEEQKKFAANQQAAATPTPTPTPKP